MKTSRFLTSTKIYKERLAICATCEYYFKPTGTCRRCGCFMRIKAKMSNLSCPAKKWLKTSVLESPDKIAPEILKEVKKIWKNIEGKKAKNHQVKKSLIEMYNTIYGAGFSTSTNCSSCLSTVYKGIENIYNTYIKKMTNYLQHLKYGHQSPSNRWVVKYDTDTGLIKEVKLVYNPKEYRSSKTAKKLYTRKTLIKVLEKDAKNRKAK